MVYVSARLEWNPTSGQCEAVAAGGVPGLVRGPAVQHHGWVLYLMAVKAEGEEDRQEGRGRRGGEQEDRCV